MKYSMIEQTKDVLNFYLLPFSFIFFYLPSFPSPLFFFEAGAGNDCIDLRAFIIMYKAMNQIETPPQMKK